MKKHKAIYESELMENLVNEFNDIEELRFLSIITHMYVEYFLNEIICNKISKPELIIDNKGLGGFYNKFTLLKSLGFFEGKEKLEKNVERINMIRNFYAHNMLIEQKIPPKIETKINEMVYLEESNTFHEDISKIDLTSKFKVKCISTIVLLS